MRCQTTALASPPACLNTPPTQLRPGGAGRGNRLFIYLGNGEVQIKCKNKRERGIRGRDNDERAVLAPRKPMSHPITLPDSVRPRMHPKPALGGADDGGFGHRGYRARGLPPEREVGSESPRSRVRTSHASALKTARRRVGCLKAAGSVYNCSAVGGYFGIQPAGRCTVSIDRQTLNDSPACPLPPRLFSLLLLLP